MSAVRALQALVDDDPEAARRAVSGDTSLLGSALAQHLDRQLDGQRSGSVYDAPAAFEAFIRGGGNVQLYDATRAALAAAYDAEQPAAVLDVGCGDGTALVPALRAARHHPDRVDVVEPSEPLLEAALSELRAWRVHPWPTTVQEFLTRLDEDDDAPAGWGVVQSTFALHTLPHAERTEVLRALLPRTGRLAVVEFDVPQVPVGSPEHLEFLARTYEQGLAEYDDDRELVAQGFLMPVLTGQLRPGAVRATFEQPAQAWAEQVRSAGFADVEVTALDDYWSSPAFLLTARGGAPLWRGPATPWSPTPRTAPPTP
ncbi:methyltransferase domain-containing protein [Streptomyces sp. NP160]|uniref:methyltransferase n=1 Tax=Streptomyces sp. NP160 TaxID=2586637 RepID=UPI0011192D14|nr:methyltransferase [Streptomyces sp. NP160]TNM59683.1 methyltransferase domain-containing protein [Streptomyces sp. NP160]